MNKNYIFVGTGISVVIIGLIAFSFSTIPTEMSLEQIIKNKDCKALQEWENNHIYEDTLELSPELKTEIFKMEMECETKAFKNIFGEK